MHLVLQTLIGQLTIGSLYALVAVGFVIVYRSTRVINFAQGLFALLGGYFFSSIADGLGLGFWVSLFLSLLLSLVFGAAVYGILLRPLVGQSPLILVMLTIALSIVLGAIILMVWGSGTRFLDVPIHGTLHLFFGVTVTVLDTTIFGVAVVLLLTFSLVLRFSRFGSAMRAAAENPLLAAYRGINVGAISAATWSLAMFGASLAGIAYGATSGLSPGIGNVLGFAAFPAIIIGGLDSVGGALVGALVLAEIQGYAVTYLGGKFSDVVGYGLLLIVLVVRPTGLFGTKEIVRL
jgi:branched-chain amino acid transport system permease protein